MGHGALKVCRYRCFSDMTRNLRQEPWLEVTLCENGGIERCVVGDISLPFLCTRLFEEGLPLIGVFADVVGEFHSTKFGGGVQRNVPEASNDHK